MTTCFICKETSSEPYCSVDGQEYFRCPGCDLIYLDRIESWERLYRSYTGGSFKSFRRKVLLPFRKFHHYGKFEYNMERARRIIGSIRDIAWKSDAAAKFLDIGCNKGFLLAGAAEQSWDVHGVEVVPEILVPFKKRYKEFADQVIVGKTADAGSRFDAASFDVITAIDVLEHLEEPFEELKTIYSLLKPGGVFVVQTPDSTGEQSRKLGVAWLSLKPLEHLRLFSPRSLELLGAQVGYAEVSIHPPFDVEARDMVAVLRK